MDSKHEILMLSVAPTQLAVDPFPGIAQVVPNQHVAVSPGLTPDGITQVVPTDHVLVVSPDQALSKVIQVAPTQQLVEVSPNQALEDIFQTDGSGLHSQIAPDVFDQMNSFSMQCEDTCSRALVPLDVFNQDEYIRYFGLIRRHVYGDGNCIFRAVSFGLFGHESSYSELRQIAVSYIREHEDDFNDFFIQGSMSDDLNGLSLDGVYAGFECKVTLSRHFRRNIFVTQGVNDNNVVNTITFDEQNSYISTAPIHIL